LRHETHGGLAAPRFIAIVPLSSRGQPRHHPISGARRARPDRRRVREVTASLTKVPLDPVQIGALVRAAFGARARIADCRAAEGGMYNAGYHLRLEGAGPAHAFLKVAPPDDLPCLTHERGLMRAEISTLQRVAAAGVGRAPAVLWADLSRQLVDRDVVVLEHLPGGLLSEAEVAAEDRPALRRQIGAVAAGVQLVAAPAFGYPGTPELQAATWPDAFGHMVDALLDDAARFGLDPTVEPLRPRFAALLPGLGGVTRPSLVHYDLWDGNILVAPGEGGWKLAGIIDWERAFYGDPVAELVSLSFHTRMSPDPAVLEGWATVAGLDLDLAARRRLALYRAYLWLIMLVEAGPRGFLVSQPDETWPALRRRLERDLAEAEG
jgi:Ser/Thr protein kinase RdoA (MazF antagonist)